MSTTAASMPPRSPSRPTTVSPQRRATGLHGTHEATPARARAVGSNASSRRSSATTSPSKASTNATGHRTSTLHADPASKRFGRDDPQQKRKVFGVLAKNSPPASPKPISARRKSSGSVHRDVAAEVALLERIPELPQKPRRESGLIGPTGGNALPYAAVPPASISRPKKLSPAEVRPDVEAEHHSSLWLVNNTPRDNAPSQPVLQLPYEVHNPADEHHQPPTVAASFATPATTQIDELEREDTPAAPTHDAVANNTAVPTVAALAADPKEESTAKVASTSSAIICAHSPAGQAVPQSVAPMVTKPAKSPKPSPVTTTGTDSVQFISQHSPLPNGNAARRPSQVGAGRKHAHDSDSIQFESVGNSATLNGARGHAAVAAALKTNDDKPIDPRGEVAAQASPEQHREDEHGAVPINKDKDESELIIYEEANGETKTDTAADKKDAKKAGKKKDKDNAADEKKTDGKRSCCVVM